MTSEPAVAVPDVGMVGLGRIGALVAQHVLASGRSVIGWARRADALEGFAARGGIVAGTLAEIGAAELVISVMFDDAATRAVTLAPGGIVGAMREGGVHVAMATMSPALAGELASAHAARGQMFLAAPFFGRIEDAAAGALAMMCAGAEEAYRAAAPVLSTYGTTRWVGLAPEQAMLVKLAGNHMILTMGELLAETFALLRAGGVDGAETKAALMDTLMPRVFAGYAQRMSEREDALRPATTRAGRKDNALVLEAAERLGIALPLARFLASEGGAVGGAGS